VQLEGLSIRREYSVAAAHFTSDLMRTFDLTLEIKARAVVPEDFTKAMREAAADKVTASPFLLNAQEMFPEDDEGFTLHILKHGTRNCIRSELARLYESSGIGGTLSPVKAVVDTNREPPAAPAVLANEVAEVIPE
jgi:hypothetical protein